MGGQGTWHIGLHHPSLFAALAPQAGWSTLHVYQPFAMQPSRMFASPEILLSRERARHDANNLFFLENAEHLPVIITQGAKDKTVPPMHARLFQKLLEIRGSTTVNCMTKHTGGMSPVPKVAVPMLLIIMKSSNFSESRKEKFRTRLKSVCMTFLSTIDFTGSGFSLRKNR